ncbi:outer membrane beta-barrel protein [Ekhidna sp.]|uniref:outer membrane beta-barrel protein n=1 Tax=Ekhidna sp. TaxID=2608089 RepID=UPI003296E853
MKRIILIAFTMIATASFAQVQKGDMNVGANFGLMKQNGDADIMNYSYSTLILNWQYYITDNVSFGVSPSIATAKVLNDAFTVKSSAWNFYLDYSFLSDNGKVLPYLGAKFTLYNTLIENGDLSGTGSDLGDGFGFGGFIPGGGGSASFETKFKRQVVSLSAGVKFFISERINIDNNLTFGTILNEKVELDFLGFPISFDGEGGGRLIQFTIGFGYIIGKKGT